MHYIYNMTTIKNIAIFDLDGTIIDSTHRQLANADGSINLEHWFANNTSEKIAKDKLLPLSKAIKNADYVVFCTSRQLQDADLDFFKTNGLLANKIISRPFGNTEKDGILKKRQLQFLVNLKQFKQATKVMFYDNAEVRQEVRKLFPVINPNKLNKEVA